MRLKAWMACVLAVITMWMSPLSAMAENAYIDAVKLETDLSSEAQALEGAQAAVPELLQASAPGVLVEENSKARVDYSNTGDGYVMVLYHAETSKRLKVQIKGPRTTYTYNIFQGEWGLS